MLRWRRSLRAKGFVAAVVPMFVTLAVVAVIGIYAYDHVARDVVTPRDSELARITAERLGERLHGQALVLVTTADLDSIRSVEPRIATPALMRAADQLIQFDAGLYLYDWLGVPVASSRPEGGVERFISSDPVSPLLNEVRVTLRPAFSDVLIDPVLGDDVVLVAVPVIGIGSEFEGILIGALTLRASLVGSIFADVLELQSGGAGLGYLVDGQGRVVYHRDVASLGTDLSALLPVQRVVAGETDALIGNDATGEEVIAGFAPVPGTGWGVVTQEPWVNIVGPIQGFGWLLLALLAGGGIASGALVFFAIGRTLGPIRELSIGTRRIAGGDFDYRIDPGATDVELSELAGQFNEMAIALQDSYGELENRVAARTEEIAAINLRTVTVADVASQVTSILGLDELLPYVTNLLYETFGYQTAYIFLREANSESLLLRAHNGGQRVVPQTERREFRIRVGEGISGWVAQHGEAVLANDVSADPRHVRRSELPVTKAELVVPIRTASGVVGIIGLEQNTLNAFDETDQFTAQTVADYLGVAIDNARLFEEARERAEEIAAINLRTATVADVASRVTSILGLDELFPYVTTLMCDTFGYQTVYVLVRDEQSDRLTLRTYSGGQGLTPPEGFSIALGEGISGWVGQHGQAVIANDVTQDPRYIAREMMPRTMAELAVPIRVADGIVGVMGIEQNTLGAFDETDLFTAETVADCLGVAIDNARLFEQAGDVAVLQERNRMAREIHDTLAQGFTGIVLQLEAADQAIEDGAEQSAVSNHLDRARDLARDSLNEARRSVWNLLPRALDGRALDAALAQEVDQFAALGREAAVFTVTGTPRSLPSDVGAALLRICQESLTNVRKHAGAGQVTVELEFRDQDVVLRVGDDGKGFELSDARQEARSRGGGLGISGMEQRATQLKGSLSVLPAKNGGTLIEVILPLTPSTAAAG